MNTRLSCWWKHLKTVTKHRWIVFQQCAKCGYFWQGLTHDLSKLSVAEFASSARYFQGCRSPIEAEKAKKGYSAAWLHHKGRNRHHFEYWTDYSLTGEGIAGVEMPAKYVAEMFCDRLAASKTYRGADFQNGDPYQFFNKGKHRRLLLHPNTEALLETMLLTLRDQGEDAAFDYVRHEVLKK